MKNEPVRFKIRDLFTFVLLVPLTFFDGGPDTGASSTTSPAAGRFLVAVSMAAPDSETDIGFRPLAASCAFKTRFVGRGAGRGLEGSALLVFFILFFSAASCSSSLADGAMSLLRFWPLVLDWATTWTGVAGLADEVFGLGWGLLATAPMGLLATVASAWGMSLSPPIKWH